MKNRVECSLSNCEIKGCPDAACNRSERDITKMNLITWPYLTAEFLRSQGLSETTPERFWSKVDKRGPNDCWEWNGFIHNGYGYIARGITNKPITAPRVSWILHYGPIPEGLEILHKCPGKHNRKCVNPAHLKPDTHEANMQDMIGQGTHWFTNHPGEFAGEKNATHKLTDKQIDEIRQKYTGKRGQQSALAREYGTCQGNIWFIVNHKTRTNRGTEPKLDAP